MKAAIDETCIACRLCVEMAPALFQMGDDNYAHPVVEQVPPGQEPLAREAADSCPVSAIHLEG